MAFRVSQDFFRDPQSKPEWAQLTRLAGDRTAILFEELRRRVGRIDGLREEICYEGPERGWGPRYKAGDRILFSTEVRPGILEVSLEVPAELRQAVLSSSRSAAGIREAFRRAPLLQGASRVRLRLSNSVQVRSFAALVMMKSKFDKADRQS